MARLLLVEDHTMFRAGIRALVERSTADHKVVGEAADGHTAARLARDLSPDIVLMDVSMPRLNGIEAARMIHRECPQTRVVMLSMHADPAYVHAALDSGASAYVLKDATYSELEAAIRSVLSGEKFLSARVRGMSRTQGLPAAGMNASPVAGLSPRERQILQLIAEAFSSAEIAEQLGLKVRTVETYRQNMMNKLNLHSAAALTRFAVRHGLCDPVGGIGDSNDSAQP